MESWADPIVVVVVVVVVVQVAVVAIHIPHVVVVVLISRRKLQHTQQPWDSLSIPLY